MFNRSSEKKEGNHSFTRIGNDTNQKALNVLFFHGLGGDALSTWTNKNGKLWPTYIEEHSEINVTVWLASYPTKWITSSSTDGSMTIREHAKSFITSMEFYGLCDHPYVCICHSLGGLIVKKIIVTCGNHQSPTKSDIYQRIFQNCKGIFFIATPHDGSSTASFAKLFPMVSEELTQLAKDSDGLLELKKDFNFLVGSNRFFVQSYYETTQTDKLGIIVTKNSATSGCLGDDPRPITSNHIDISKPESLDSDLCKGIVSFLREKAPLFEAKSIPKKKPHNSKNFIKGILVDPFTHSVNVKLIEKFIINDEVIPARFFYDTDQCAHNWCEFAEYTTPDALHNFMQNEGISEFFSGWRGEALPYVSIGPGDGRKDLELINSISQYGISNFNYMPLDISTPLIKRASERINNGARRAIEVTMSFILGDLESIQRIKDYLPQERVVISVFGNTIGNLMDDGKVISGLHKIMKAKDILLLEVRSLEEKRGFMEDNQEGEESDYITKASAFSSGPLLTLGESIRNGEFKLVEDNSHLHSDIEKTETIVVQYYSEHRRRFVKLDKINFYNKPSLDAFLKRSKFKIVHSDAISGNIFYFLER